MATATMEPDWTHRLKELQQDEVTLHYSPESEPLAQGLLAYAAKCNAYLTRLFRLSQPLRQTVYWMAKADWRGKPDTYGFPYANGADAYLAAADVDLPTQLALCADSMDLDRGGPAAARMAALLDLPDGAGPAAVRKHLSESSEFFVVWTAGQILPHELTHGYCNALGYPQLPRWWYEGAAQWAAFHMQKDLRSAREAELIYEYYQLLWDRAGDRLPVRDFAEADRLGAGSLTTPNYAWYHAGLLRMFRELEQRKGGNPLPELIPRVGAKHSGQTTVPEEDMIQTFSEVIGRDLRTWFADPWGLGR